MKEIKATKGFSFFVDDEDYEKVNSYLWYTKNIKSLNFFSDLSGAKLKKALEEVKYLSTDKLNGKNKYVLSPEQLIVDYDKSTHFVSFVNHMRNDFRKENLRIIPNEYVKLHRASPSNKSTMYRGVGVKRKKFYAYLLYRDENNVTHKIAKYGFETEGEAALAYNELAKEYYGEYAYLNILGQDSRQPNYVTLEESFSKRSKKAVDLEKGFSEHNGRYFVQINKRSIANVDNKNDAGFLYNLATKQIYGDKADLNKFSPDSHEGERLFFYTPFSYEGKEYETLWDACIAKKKDVVSLYQLLMRKEDLHEAFKKTPQLLDEGPVRFNKYKYLHECWVDDTFEGFYLTTEDAMYAYNQIKGELIYNLPSGFVGKPMVVGKDSTIVYKDKKYPSINVFTKIENISNVFVCTYIDKYPLEDIVEVWRNNYSFVTEFTVDNKNFYSIKQFLDFANISRYELNKIKNTLINAGEPHTMQDIFNYLKFQKNQSGLN